MSEPSKVCQENDPSSLERLVRPQVVERNSLADLLGRSVLDHPSDPPREARPQNHAEQQTLETGLRPIVDHLGNRIERCEVSCEDVVESVVGGPLRLLGKHLQAGTPSSRTIVECNSLCGGVVWSNDPSSATRPTRRFDCNSDAMAGFAAAHG